MSLVQTPISAMSWSPQEGAFSLGQFDGPYGTFSPFDHVNNSTAVTRVHGLAEAFKLPYGGINIWETFAFISLDRGLPVVLLLISLNVSVALCRRRIRYADTWKDYVAKERTDRPFNLAVWIEKFVIELAIEVILFAMFIFATMITPAICLLWFTLKVYSLDVCTWKYTLINELGILYHTYEWYRGLRPDEGSFFGYLRD